MQNRFVLQSPQDTDTYTNTIFFLDRRTLTGSGKRTRQRSSSIKCKDVWVCEIARFVVLVWHKSELCIAWPRRAPPPCHAKAQFLMRNTRLRSMKKICLACQRIIGRFLFPSLHYKFLGPDIFAMHKQEWELNVKPVWRKMQQLGGEIKKKNRIKPDSTAGSNNNKPNSNQYNNKLKKKILVSTYYVALVKVQGWFGSLEERHVNGVISNFPDFEEKLQVFDRKEQGDYDFRTAFGVDVLRKERIDVFCPFL